MTVCPHLSNVDEQHLTMSGWKRNIPRLLLIAALNAAYERA